MQPEALVVPPLLMDIPKYPGAHTVQAATLVLIGDKVEMLEGQAVQVSAPAAE